MTREQRFLFKIAAKGSFGASRLNNFSANLRNTSMRDRSTQANKLIADRQKAFNTVSKATAYRPKVKNPVYGSGNVPNNFYNPKGVKEGQATIYGVGSQASSSTQGSARYNYQNNVLKPIQAVANNMDPIKSVSTAYRNQLYPTAVPQTPKYGPLLANTTQTGNNNITASSTPYSDLLAGVSFGQFYDPIRIEQTRSTIAQNVANLNKQQPVQQLPNTAFASVGTQPGSTNTTI